MSAAHKLSLAMIKALRSIQLGGAIVGGLTGVALVRRGLAAPFREEHAGYIGRVYTITTAGRAALAKVTP